MNRSELQNLFENLKSEDKVFVAHKKDSDVGFESDYIALRKKENRLYPDNIVKQLPDGKETSQPDEWKMRSKSAKRLMDYFQQQHGSNILDLGCGNGWFSAMLAASCNCEVIGVDLNRTELEQAARVFDKPNLNFIYTNIFDWPKSDGLFDFVTINAAIQYFPNFDKLIKRLFKLLKEGGEVHIIDSPFYKKEEVEAAKIRSRKYYSEMGFAKMADNYFHHTFEELNEFDFSMMYKPQKATFLGKFFKEKDIPFPWVKINSGLDFEPNPDW